MSNLVVSAQDQLRQSVDHVTKRRSQFDTGQGSEYRYPGGAFGGLSSQDYYEKEATNLWDSLGEFGGGLFKGTASGLTFGAAEFAGGAFEVNWDQMSGSEKAGYIVGEAATMLVPFGWMSKGARFATAGLKGGARHTIKKVAKKTLTDSELMSGGIIKQISKEARKQGVSPDKIRKQLPINIQNKLYKDLNKWEKGSLFSPIKKPWLDNVYSMATQGALKQQSRDVIKTRVKASILESYRTQGLKIGRTQLDDLAAKFADDLAKGVKFGDSAGAIARAMGRTSKSGVLHDVATRYFSHAFNTSAMMITDQMVRSKMHSLTREDHEFNAGQALTSGTVMGFAFPLIQGFPQLHKSLGTGHMRLREAFPKMMQRFSRTNYKKMVKKSGEVPVRRLLQQQAQGGLYDIHSSSRLGRSMYKVNGNEYKGGWDIVAKVMSKTKGGDFKMPIDDVTAILKTMQKVVGKESSKAWFKKYMLDAIGSAPRVAFGMTLMGGPQHWDDLWRGELEMSEFVAHMMVSAVMTKNKGGWGLQKHWDFKADMKPYENALTNLGLGKNTLREVMGMGEHDINVETLGIALKDTKAGRAIEDSFDNHLNPESTPQSHQSGYEPASHKKVMQYQNIYNAIKKQNTPRGEPDPEVINIKNMQYSKAELDRVANDLNEIQMEDGTYIKDIGIGQFKIRSMTETIQGTRKAYEILLKTLKDAGVHNIKETHATKEGDVKFQVGMIRAVDSKIYKDLGDFTKYNELITKLDKIGMVEIIDRPLSRTTEQFENFEELAGLGEKGGLFQYFNQTIKGLNKGHNMPNHYVNIANNSYLDALALHGNTRASIRLFEILNGNPKLESDLNLMTKAERMFNRGGGKMGFLSHIEKYEIDYKQAAKELDVSEKVLKGKEGYEKSELQEGLRPLLELLRFKNNGPVDPLQAKEAIPVQEARQISNSLKDITNMMNRATKKDFYKEGANFFMKDMLSSEGLDGRVINSIVELQHLGLGTWDQAAKKISVPDLKAVAAMAKNDPLVKEGEASELVTRTEKLYDSIGRQYLKEDRYYINPTDEVGYKSPSVTEFVKIYENFRTEKLKGFVDNAKADIKLLRDVPGMVETNLDGIAKDLSAIYLDLAGKNVPDKLMSISSLLKNLRGSPETAQHPLHKKIDKLIGQVDGLRTEINNFEGPSIIGKEVLPTDKFGNLKTQMEIIEDLSTLEAGAKYDFQRLIMNTQRGVTNHDGLSREAGIRMTEAIGKELHSALAGHSKGAHARELSELIEEVNSSKSWGLLKGVLRDLHVQQTILMDKSKLQDTPKTEMAALENMHENKQIHNSSETLQSIAQRFALTDPMNPMDIDPAAVEIVTRAAKNKSPKILSNLTDLVDKNIFNSNKTAQERAEMLKKWDSQKIPFTNMLLKRKTVRQGSLIYDGEKLVMNINSEHITRETPITEWIDSKQYDVTFVQDNIIKPDKFTGVMKLGELRDISDTKTSSEALNLLLKDGVEIIPEAHYNIMKDVADGNPISMDHVLRRAKEMEGGESAKESGAFVRLTGGAKLIFAGTKVNYTKLNKDYQNFYDNVKFKDTTVKDESGRSIKVSATSLQRRFETTFKDLYDITNPDRNQTALKLHAMFEFESKPGMFNKYLANLQIGNMNGRALLESNMVKRGALIDGGTTMKMHPLITEAMAKDPNIDPLAREFAEFLVNNNHKRRATIFADEAKGAGTNIAERVVERYGEKQKSYKKTGDALSDAILENQIKRIKDGEIPSVNNSSTDGQKYLSLRATKFEIAFKGENPDIVSGHKTITFQLGENSLLGKGYVIYDPAIAKNLPKDVDMAMGESAAKEFSPNITPLEVPGKEWYKELSKATSDNIIELDNGNIGLGFVAKDTKGVTISQSMVDLEGASYNKTAKGKDFMDVKKQIRILDNVSDNRMHDEGKLLEFIKQTEQDQSLTLSEGSVSLLNDIIGYGGKYSNPAIKRQADRSLQDYYFKSLNNMTTKHGRDLTIGADAESKLEHPEIANFEDTNGQLVFRKNKTFGEIAPDRHSLSENLNSLEHTTFAIKYKGVDYIVDGLGKEVNSPFIEGVSKNYKKIKKGNYRLQGDSKNTHNKTLVDQYSNKAQLYKEVLNTVKPIIEKLNNKMKDRKFSMVDIYDLMKGGKIPGGYTHVRFTAAERQLIKDFNIALAVDGIAIPLKGKDKVVQRINEVHDHTGIVKINHYDERVVHQRDNDGDHFYMYNQVPFSMSKKHAKDQAFMEDFKMFKKETPEIDIFGIEGEGAAETAGTSADVGPGKYIDHLGGQSRNIGTLIGDKKGASMADLYDIHIGTQRFTKKLSEAENYTEPAGKVGTRLFTDLQNAVEIHNGTANVMRDLKRWNRYGETTESELLWAKNSKGEEKPIDLNRKEQLFEIFPKDAPLIKGQGKPLREVSHEVERNVHDVIVNVLKGVNVIGSDVYDGSLSSSPRPAYITQKYYDLKNFWITPEKFIVTKLAERYALDKVNGRTNLFELMRLFYEGTSGYSKNVTSGKWYENFMQDLIKGNISENFNPNRRITFGNFKTPKTQWREMFDALPQGEVLREVVTRKLFQDSEGIQIAGDPKKVMKTSVLHRKIGSVVHEALNRINLLKLSGRNIDELALDFNWHTEVPEFKKEMKPVAEIQDALGRGAIRGALNNLFGRLQRDKAYHEGLGKKGEQRVSDLENQLANIESGISILDKQYADGIIGENKPGTKIEQGVGDKKKVNQDTFVLYYKGDKTDINKFLKEGTVDLESFEREGWVKEGDSYSSYKANTYVEIANPIMHEKVSTKHKRYAEALREIGEKSDISNVGLDDIQQLTLIEKTNFLQRSINENYSRSIKDGKVAALSKRIWKLSDNQDMAALGKYYEGGVKLLQENNSKMDEAMAVEWLTRYLIKPKPLMGKYTSVDGMEVPYYSINERLQSQTYRFLSSGQRRANNYHNIVETLIKQQEGRVDGTLTLADIEASTHFNMVQDGYNYEAFGKWADVVRSLSGPEFSSPFWTEYKNVSLHGYVSPKTRKSFDGYKVATQTESDLGPNGCR